ncbi:MAG: hypothetical protein ABI557_18075, partial [Aureliella sp.]
MNKTTTRLAATGGVIVLGAFALVLAQSDARKREREQPLIEPVAGQIAVPIPIDDGDGSWGLSHESPSNQHLERANDDQFTRYGSNRESEQVQLVPAQPEDAADVEDFDLSSEKNPLRNALLERSQLERSQVVLASAGAPVEPPATGRPSTSSPPGWLSQDGTGAQGAEQTDLKPLVPAANSVRTPTLPTFPMSPGSDGLVTAGSGGEPPVATTPGGTPLPSMAAALPTFPPTLS